MLIDSKTFNMGIKLASVNFARAAGISRAYGGALSALVISYTLSPVIPLSEDQQPPVFSPKTENIIRWIERETVMALYEGNQKQVIVNAARNINLDTRPPQA